MYHIYKITSNTVVDFAAEEAAIAFLEDFGKRELAIEHYYDQFMARNAFNAIVNTKSDFDQ